MLWNIKYIEMGISPSWRMAWLQRIEFGRKLQPRVFIAALGGWTWRGWRALKGHHSNLTSNPITFTQVNSNHLSISFRTNSEIKSPIVLFSLSMSPLRLDAKSFTACSRRPCIAQIFAADHSERTHSLAPRLHAIDATTLTLNLNALKLRTENPKSRPSAENMMRDGRYERKELREL